MINQKEDIINSIGKTIFIVFFFLLISSFSNKSDKQTNDISQCKVIYELHSNPAQAVIVGDFSLPSVQKSVTLLDNINSNFFNEDLKIFADSKKITQRIILLQKTQLSIKPITICRFYCHRFSTEVDEIPILS
jgi:hypothetical protein